MAYSESISMFSPTSLIQFHRCPRRWYNNKILHLEGEEVDISHLLFGRVTHSVLENFYDKIQIDDALKNARQHFSIVFKNLSSEHWDFNIPEKKFAELETIGELFVENQSARFEELLQQDKLDIFCPFVVEDDIVSEKYHMHCIVDRINHGFTTFADYKTTKQFPEILLFERETLSDSDKLLYDDTRFEYIVQAMMNALCIHDKYNVMPSAAIFIFLRHLGTKDYNNGLLQIEITQEDIDFVANLNNQAVEMIENNCFPLASDMNNCNKYKGCEFKRFCSLNGVCLSAL